MRELVDEASDVFDRESFQQTEGAQSFMTALEHALGWLSGQHRRDMPDAKPLSRADDARQDLLRHDDGIGDRLQLAETPVARTAGRGAVLLSEVLDERAMAALRRGDIPLDITKVLAIGVTQFAVGLEQAPPPQKIRR